MFTAELVEYNTKYNGRHVLLTKDFETIERFDAVNKILLDVSPSTWWESDTIGQCELCNKSFPKVEVVLGGRTGKSTFCCQQCKDDADEEIQTWDRIDADESRYTSDHDYSMNG